VKSFFFEFPFHSFYLTWTYLNFLISLSLSLFFSLFLS
jgi:hypothetical protein